MTTQPRSSGFGKPVNPPRKPSAPKNQERRKAAATQYDKLKTDGLPEFNIYMRIQDQGENWFPAGSMAVSRSSAIDQAIFENEEELRKGAFRLFPALRKKQDSLEYGYRLKQFPDEPIQVAVRPIPGVPGIFQKVAQKVRSLFQKKA
ncbi:HHL1-like protein [Leptolyngbya sp. FACHB-261]|uniref:HHL1-like protein n=1 Tax=Leptolyngbya sp. FACHB-261 TaxID=2692806 RepID=UPI001689689B|nr:HHL1-like protein [Leptolyngbya sp. FACHB-261]MBD2102791.1 hypothetical protein [Leptolyngbya sp. FACHB-261]